MLRSLNYKRTILIIGLLLSIVALAPMLANAESSNKDTSSVLLRKGAITIHGKGEDYIVSLERRFALDDTTILTDMSNNTIFIETLPIPCIADIVYQLRMDKAPLLLSLRIKKILPDAHTDWSGEGEGTIPSRVPSPY